MRTIRSSREIDRVFRTGARCSHSLVVALAVDSPEYAGSAGRVAFAAGTKLGGAVYRNRCKRVMRHACARAGGPWAGTDVVFIARAGTGFASGGELDAAFGHVLTGLRLGR